MTNEEIVAGTLAWCNIRRKEKQLTPLDELPKGIKRDGLSCPCGTACGGYVGRSHYWVSEDDWRAGREFSGDVPEAVTQFVEMFDNGGFPEYDIEKTQ